MKKKKKHIVVLMGGPSLEHDVSLHTGEQIVAYLDPRYYDVTPVIITKKREWIVPMSWMKSKRISDTIKVGQQQGLEMVALHADAVFIALHGAFGEDGTIQCLLDAYDIPYTGSEVLASALAMDKIKSSYLFRDAHMHVPLFHTCSIEEIKHINIKQIKKYIHELGLPLVIKPSNQGSSIGVSIARDLKDIKKALEIAKKYSPYVMIQQFIEGKEITCGVIDRIEHGKALAIPLPPLEIIPRKGAFYDYASKYEDAGSDHLLASSRISAHIVHTIQDMALRAHRLIGCLSFSRSDFIIGKDGTIYILEINTIPGMTSTSLLPQAAQMAGIDFSNLLDIIVTNTLKKKKLLYI